MAVLLYCRHPIPQNDATPKRILLLPTHISGITLHSIDYPILHLFHDPNMVRHTVLGGPVEEDEHSGGWFRGAVQPEATLLEPLHSEDAAGEFGVGSVVQVAALVGTPGDEAGAPLYMVGKAVPAPIGFAAHVAHLGQGYIHNGIPVLRGVEHLADWVVPQHMGDVLLVPVAVPAHLLRHLHGEFYGIGTGILAVFLQGPSDVASTKIIALEGQLNMIQVNGAFGSGCLQTVRKILDAY